MFEYQHWEMTLKVLFQGFCLVAFVGQGQKCDAAEIYSCTSAVETYLEEWFPQDIEFNASCVAEGCPALNNMSFCQSELDMNAIRNITKTISDCMSGPICGIVIDPRPLKSFVISLDQALPGSKVKGMATTAPGGGYLSNISNIQLDITPNQSRHLPLQMTVSIPNIRFRGHYKMDLRLETGFGPDLTASLPQATYDFEIQFVSICSINHTGSSLDITFVNPIVKISPQLCGIELPPYSQTSSHFILHPSKEFMKNQIWQQPSVDLWENCIQARFRPALETVNRIR